MLHKNVIEQSGFRTLAIAELASVAGGVVSFTDGTAQERRDGAKARAELAQAEDFAAQYGLFGEGDSAEGEGSSGNSNGTIVTEDFNSDGVVDAVSEIDADGNWVKTIGLTDEFDKWADATREADGTVPWHSSAIRTGASPILNQDGSFYGGAGFALGTGAEFGISEAGSHGSWVLGAGYILEFGYSTDSDKASYEADNTELQLPGVYPVFDWAPLTDWTEFTAGLQINIGALWPIAEDHSEPETDTEEP